MDIGISFLLFQYDLQNPNSFKENIFLKNNNNTFTQDEVFENYKTPDLIFIRFLVLSHMYRCILSYCGNLLIINVTFEKSKYYKSLLKKIPLKKDYIGSEVDCY